MNCPLQNAEQVLLDFAAGKLDRGTSAGLEQHMLTCSVCREFTAAQHTVWGALESWQAPPVSADFDHRLYRRIQEEVSFWDRLVRPFRPLILRRGLPVAAAACLLIMASVLADRPVSSSVSKSDNTQIESVQPEQVEQALDAMEMLHEFSHRVRNEGAESKI